MEMGRNSARSGGDGDGKLDCQLSRPDAFVQSEIGTLKITFKLLLACALSLAVVAVYLQASFDRRDPIVGPMLTTALNSPVPPGEPLRVRIERVKVRDDCPVVSVRRFISESGEEIPVPTAISAGGDADRRYVEWDYPLVPGMDPSQTWELWVWLTYICPGLEPFQHQQKPVKFRIEQ